MQAATWQEHKSTGFRAFDSRDYQGAVEQFRAALTNASKAQASSEELGAIQENLATAYLASGQLELARKAIEQWDKLLAASAHEPWAAKQQAYRNNLIRLIGQALGDTGPAAHATRTAAKATLPAPSGDHALHLESVKIADNIEPSWRELKAAYGTLLADKSLAVEQIDLGERGIYYRLLAQPFATSAQARTVCRQLRRLGQYCAVLTLR